LGAPAAVFVAALPRPLDLSMNPTSAAAATMNPTTPRMLATLDGPPWSVFDEMEEADVVVATAV
jgi:hypothetical protein